MRRIFDLRRDRAPLPVDRQRPSFVIPNLESLPESTRLFLQPIAYELTRRIPSLALHGVFGKAANQLTLHEVPERFIEVNLGPKCGGQNCSGGDAGLWATIAAIKTYLEQRPEIKAGGMRYVITDIKREALAWN